MQSNVMQEIKGLILSICSKGWGTCKQYLLPQVTFYNNPLLTTKQHLSRKWLVLDFCFPASQQWGEHKDIEKATLEWKVRLSGIWSDSGETSSAVPDLLCIFEL